MLVQSQLYSSVTRVLHPACGVYAPLCTRTHAILTQVPQLVDVGCALPLSCCSPPSLSYLIFLITLNISSTSGDIFCSIGRIDWPRDHGGGFITTRDHVPPGISHPSGVHPQGCTTPHTTPKSGRTQWYDVRLATTSLPLPCPKLFILQNNKNFIIVIPWYHSSWNKYFCWFRMYYFYYLYAKTQKARTCLECTTTFVTAQTSLVCSCSGHVQSPNTFYLCCLHSHPKSG